MERPAPRSAAPARPTDRQQWIAILRHRRGRVLLLVASLVVAGIAASGGFEPASSLPGARHPVLVAGQTVDTGAFAVTPLRAWVADAPPGAYPKEGQRVLMLRLRVENRTGAAFAASALFAQDVVWLPDGRSNERKAQPLRRADDHTLTVQLQPGVPVVVDMAWEFDASEALRTPPTWGVYARRFVERGYLQGEGDAGWKQDAPLAKIVLEAGAPPEAG
ncbi:hypothetical protein [Luteimonas kalidii]|uniref:DUF4352 domain-containing protein n=1 Tax=Luteimonas kalidii TaxID=3042025 RepID=A0ABT6JWI8_9GAMM|nr:hypothetical protein [Luteimonas kalidii]MDH5835045.1 hypothetical protein [Luteimonas kalidii]